MTDIGEVTTRLKENKEQLASIEQLLKSNPNDQTLLKLQSDLRQVVALTEDLSKMAGVPPLPVETEESKWKVGDRCEALWSEDGKWYVARVESVDDLATYTVTYLEYGNKSSVAESSLKPYTPASVDQLSQGTAVKAFWQGQVYPGAVSGPGSTPGTFSIKFAKWKKKRDVPANDIVLRDEPNAAAKEGPLPEKLEIPDHLLIKPTDTDVQKKIKMKKMKRLKSMHHKRKVEEIGNEKKNNWLNFIQNKKQKTSIFASPTAVEGRVGVTGSGKAMTTFSDRGSFFGLKTEAKLTKPGEGDDFKAS
jgi:survival-of-motor-neuron-related-splicing factor 30